MKTFKIKKKKVKKEKLSIRSKFLVGCLLVLGVGTLVGFVGAVIHQ